MDPHDPFLPAVALAALTGALAAVLDLRSRRIPNWLTYTQAALALLWIAHSGDYALIAGGLLAAALGASLVLGAGLGMGDAKLMLGFGLLLGPLAFTWLFSIAVALGAVMGLAALLWHWQRTAPTVPESGAIADLRLPFGVPLGLAAVGQALAPIGSA